MKPKFKVGDKVRYVRESKEIVTSWLGIVSVIDGCNYKIDWIFEDGVKGNVTTSCRDNNLTSCADMNEIFQDMLK